MGGDPGGGGGGGDASRDVRASTAHQTHPIRRCLFWVVIM